MKILSSDTDKFTKIKECLREIADSELMTYIGIAAEAEGSDPNKINVVLRNNVKFKKDLNKNKYIIPIPTKLNIESFEIVKSMEMDCRVRRPMYAVVIKSNIASSPDINLILVFAGFNEENIRIIKEDVNAEIEETSFTSSSCELKPEEELLNTIKDTLD